MQKIIIGNWKMNKTKMEVISFFDSFNKLTFNENITIGFAPTNLFLDYCANEKYQIYAQDCSPEISGAFTSWISQRQLTSINIKHVLIGHSEVRENNNDSDQIINKKIITLLENDFQVIICIGEDLMTYQVGKTITFLKNQLLLALQNTEKLENLIIAYEPLWAIGSGIIPSNNEIATISVVVKAFIKETFNCNVKVLYGGSVNLKNISLLTTINEIDGFLVGNASLDALDFSEIINLIK